MPLFRAATSSLGFLGVESRTTSSSAETAPPPSILFPHQQWNLFLSSRTLCRVRHR